MVNLYERLGLLHTATAQEVKQAYRDLAKLYHPDASRSDNTEDRFISITEAYEILSDPVKRRHYDLTKLSPSPRNASRRSARRYERSTDRDREEARTRAKEYGRMSYEKFDHEYFDNTVDYIAPKMLGCFGLITASIIVLFVEGFLFEFFDVPDSISIPIFLLSLPTLIIAGTWASADFDVRHNARQKDRKMQREAQG